MLASIALLAGCNAISGVYGFETESESPPLEVSDAGTVARDGSGSGGSSGSYTQGPPPAPPPSDGGDDASRVDGGKTLHVFVTSTKASSSFGGADGGDQICQTRAAEAGRPGHWVAWLSVTTTATISASTRITADGPWALFNGTIAVASRAELTGGSITHPIDVDEKGATEIVDSVWTGTNATGSGTTTDCAGWLGFGCIGTCPTGTSGRTNVKAGGWTSHASNACLNTEQRLYCFEN